MKNILFTLALLIPLSSFGQTSSEYFKSGLNNAKNGDYYGAIADFNKTIELDPDFADAYENRGISKRKLKDYYGAIADYNKAIELDPNYIIAYANRGAAKELLGDMSGACSDWKKAANLGDTKAAKWVANQCN